MTLTITPLPHIPLIQPGDDLVEILLNSVTAAHVTIDDSDILVLAQKIVSKAENRMVNLAKIKPSEKAREVATQAEKDPRLVELIIRESKELVRVRPGTIIAEHKLGFICANAGIDHSNVQGTGGNPDDWVLLLPENPDRSALEIRRKIKLATGHRVGVMIIDSHGRPWREGAVGTTIGLSGIPGIVDRRGWKDLFGYQLRVTTIAAADELAGAASLVMGEAAERIPAVHVRGFPYPLAEGSIREIMRPKDKDMFR
jgi:coenzyme F420-0:L-glutamate ligase/coenzyme F420-1:gamma-L-glutamate ligase